MSDDKKPVSFRFDPEILRLLDELKSRLHMTRTGVIVAALIQLGKKEGVK